MDKRDIRWSDRKRTFLGLPLSFTKYVLTEEKLYISTGFFTTLEDEIRLYRILDVSLRRTFGQKMFGLGSIHVCSSDKSCPEITIKNIKKSSAVKELLSDLVEAERLKKKTMGKELFIDSINDDDDDRHDFD
ncbi:MAG: PH domain-containing protein [Clostridiales bacterium]|nr:PH domain-containing protein [Clostridiales bacterium]